MRRAHARITPRQRRHFAWPFQVANDAMQMDIHETLCPFYSTDKKPDVTAAVQKTHSVDSNSQVHYDILHNRVQAKHTKSKTYNW